MSLEAGDCKEKAFSGQGRGGAPYLNRITPSADITGKKGGNPYHDRIWTPFSSWLNPKWDFKREQQQRGCSRVEPQSGGGEHQNRRRGGNQAIAVTGEPLYKS